MKHNLDYRMDIRMSPKVWFDLTKLSGQSGYKSTSSYVRALVDSILYGATDEKQAKIAAALTPFMDQSYIPENKTMNDFFEFLSQDEYLMTTVRITAEEFYENVIDFGGHPEESTFLQNFTRRYKYAILPRDMKYLINVYYNDPVINKKLRDRYTALVKYHTMDCPAEVSANGR